VSGTQITARLSELLAEAGLDPIDPTLFVNLSDYLALILRWNQRINLTSIRDEDGILKWHFVESIACARALPAGVRGLLDFGSGAGFPGIPIALCRSEITVTLAESQSKKSAFLREAARALAIDVRIHAGRAESLEERFDCVVLRAVDRMEDATRAAAGLVASHGWLAVLAGSPDAHRLRSAAGAGFQWSEPLALPFSDSRLLLMGQRKIAPTADGADG
jgi:16S rRNA (guanine527-N7)-methyltransferase